MIFLLQLAKSIHIIGLAMLLGGLLGSFLFALIYKNNSEIDKAARISSHYLAGVGLLLAIGSGIWYSSLIDWVIFKNAGFMHAKMLFVVLIFIFLFIEIRAQGVSRRALANRETNKDINLEKLQNKLLRRRMVFGALSIISFLFILVLIEFRFF